MINEERVKELYEISVYDSTKARKYNPTGKYYRSDYIGKEMIKSIFSGTAAYILCVLLWIFYDLTNILESINSLDVIALAVDFTVRYVIFLVIYELITYAVYYGRYKEGRRELKSYCGHLKKINKLYDREEKLKAK